MREHGITGRRLRTLLARAARRRVAVVGDLMLDRYLYGAADRLSPEAPVPVVRVRRECDVPGGASNVAWNVRALGGAASVCGVIGRDAPGRALRGLLAERGVDTTGVQETRAARTTVKTRVLADRQQAVRIDWEDELRLPPAELNRFCGRVADTVAGADALVMEDYGKGTLAQAVADAALRAAAARGIPSGYDPKDDHALAVRGVTVATPNRKEAFICAGRPDPGGDVHPLRDRALRAAGEALLEKWEAKHLLITLGPQGMLLMAPGASPRHIPTRAREVYDVSGAGDTVIATCLLALAAGADFAEAAEMANYAAGVVVGKLGTATCSPAELRAAVAADTQ